jgi:undecaprenyl-diphosphatase
MLGALLAWDECLFRLLNAGWVSPTFDRVLPWMTDAGHYTIPFLLVSLVILIAGRLRGLRFLALAIVSVVVADAISTHLLKHTLWRPRPCVALEAVRLLVGCVNSPSFPSNHAVNGSALATLAGLHGFRFGLPVAALALVVGYSRIYVGAHYPLDVLAGSVLGIVVALVLSGVLTLVWPAGARLKGRRGLSLLRLGDR